MKIAIDCMHKMKRQYVQDEINYYCLLLIAVTLPFPNYALNSFFIIALIANRAISILMDKKIVIDKNDIKILIWPIAFFLLYLTGVIYSDNLKEALSSVSAKLPFLFFPLVILSSSPIDERRLRRIFIAFLISCVFISILCVCYTFYINAKEDIDFTYYNSWLFSGQNLIRKFGFSHVYFSMFLCFCVAIAGSLIAAAKKRSLKICLVILLVYMILFIMGLASRMGLISLFLTACLFILYSFKKNILLKLVVILLVLISLLSIGLQFPTVKEKFTGLWNTNADDSSYKHRAQVRTIIWKSCLNIIKENWIIGVGTGDLQEHLIKEYKLVNYEEGLEADYNPHNQYLDTLGSVGIAGLIVLLIMIFMPVQLSLKNSDLVHLSFILVVSLFFAIESVLARQKGIVFFAYFFSLLYVYHKQKLNSAMNTK